MDKSLANGLQAGEFLIGDYTSSQLFSKIENRPTIPKPRRKVTASSVSHRSGLLLFDEKAYENSDFELNLFFKADSEKERDERRDLITYVFDTGSYVPFIPYFDKNKIYEVHTIEPPIFQGNIARKHYEKYTLSLTSKPFKILTSSDVINLTKGQTITNPSMYQSKPIFEIFGTGDIVLKINGIDFAIKNIQNSIIINSNIPSAYRIPIGGQFAINEENKVYTRNYPVLKPGANVITWTGTNITKVTINPRWWSL